MINILLTAIGGDIGQGVLKSLKLSSYKNNIRIIGTDITERAAGLFMCNTAYLFPRAAEEKDKYLKKLVTICRREKIDIVFVCNEDEQLLISSNIDQLRKKTKAYFVVNSLHVISISRDKFKTHKFMSKYGIRYPDSAVSDKGINTLIKRYGFPIILKPRGGYGGFQQFHIIHNKRELNNWRKQMHGALAQEYIDNGKNEEYTVGLFLDDNSKVLGAIPMLRQLRFSMTWHAIIDDYQDVVATATKTAEAIGAIGPCNIQLKRDKSNQPCVIEINSRISSTTAFRALLGFNEAESSIDLFLKNKKPNLKYKKAVAMKIWDELIVPVNQYKKLAKYKKVINH